MQVKLERPWNEWKVRTVIGKHIIDAQLDTGSSLTLIGINNARII